MEIDAKTILLLIMIVIAGGTIINYIQLRVSTERFWRKVDNKMTAKDVRNILRKLKQLDDIEALQNKFNELDKNKQKVINDILNDLNDKINQTIHRYAESMKIMSNSFTNVAIYAEEKNYQDVVERFNNEVPNVNKAFDLIDTLNEVWPDMIRFGGKDDEE